MKIIVVLLAFAAGFSIGIMLKAPAGHSHSLPIKVDYCFLASNLELFENRQVLTSAKIVVSIHGESLWNNDCPLGGLPFTSTLRRDPLVDALNAQLHLGAEVPVTFVATVNTPSRMETAFSDLKHRLGVRQPYKSSIVITQIISTGKSSR